MQCCKILWWMSGTIICVGTTTTRVEPSHGHEANGQCFPRMKSTKKETCRLSRKCQAQARWPASGITSQNEQADHASKSPDTKPLRVQVRNHPGLCSLGSRSTRGEIKTQTPAGGAAALAGQGRHRAAAVPAVQGGFSIENDYGRRRDNLDRKSTTVEHAAADADRPSCNPRRRRTPQLSPLPQQLVALPSDSASRVTK